MAAGVPVVASDLPAVRELIDGRRARPAGRRPTARASWPARSASCSTTPSDRAAMGAAARAHIARQLHVGAERGATAMRVYGERIPAWPTPSSRRSTRSRRSSRRSSARASSRAGAVRTSGSRCSAGRRLRPPRRRRCARAAAASSRAAARRRTTSRTRCARSCYPLLPILREDQDPEVPLELWVDLTGADAVRQGRPEHARVQEGRLPQGRRHASTTTRGSRAARSFADGAHVQFAVIDHVRSQFKDKRNPRGKIKRKTKNKKKTELTVTLTRPEPRCYAAGAGSGRGVPKQKLKPGDKPHEGQARRHAGRRSPGGRPGARSRCSS